MSVCPSFCVLLVDSHLCRWYMCIQEEIMFLLITCFLTQYELCPGMLMVYGIVIPVMSFPCRFCILCYYDSDASFPAIARIMAIWVWLIIFPTIRDSQSGSKKFEFLAVWCDGHLHHCYDTFNRKYENDTWKSLFFTMSVNLQGFEVSVLIPDFTLHQDDRILRLAKKFTTPQFASTTEHI